MKPFFHIVGYDHEEHPCRPCTVDRPHAADWRIRDAPIGYKSTGTGTLPPIEKEYFAKDGSRVPVLIGAATFEEAGTRCRIRVST